MEQSGGLPTQRRFATEQGVGLLHWVALPPWAAVVVTLLALDFAIYLQHVLTMRARLWRVHKSITPISILMSPRDSASIRLKFSSPSA